MKIFFWIVKLLLFLVALTFAVKNTDMVTVRYYLGVQWQAPLIFVILLVFCMGAVAGVFASLGHIVRLRRDISRLRREISAVNVSEKTVNSSAARHIADAM